MATTKAASTKKATAKKQAAASTTVRTVRATPKTEVRTVSVTNKSSLLPDNIANIVTAELLGTFILTLVAMLAFKETISLYVGLTVAALVLAVGAISGGHFNPAVSFGLWTMRKLKTILVPFYWLAQFIGAALAVVVTNWMTHDALKLNFEHVFATPNWSLVGVELVGTAVFVFGLAAVISRFEAGNGMRALGIGLSLTVGLLVSGSLLAGVQGAIDTSKITSVADVPHALRVKGATLNPAVALASTEATDGSFTGSRAASTDKQFTRLGWETIIGPLVGAALGGNLYLLVAGRRNNV